MGRGTAHLDEMRSESSGRQGRQESLAMCRSTGGYGRGIRIQKKGHAVRLVGRDDQVRWNLTRGETFIETGTRAARMHPEEKGTKQRGLGAKKVER
jgi:hypothetical protein